jgi:cell division protein FtsI (penicillin-binding protein 3)
MNIQNRNITLQLPAKAASEESITPSVVGMGLKDAVYLAENIGLKVTATGRGKVINQSIIPGTPFKKGQILTLFLN